MVAPSAASAATAVATGATGATAATTAKAARVSAAAVGAALSESAVRLDDWRRLAKSTNVRRFITFTNQFISFSKNEQCLTCHGFATTTTTYSYYFNLATEISQSARPKLTIECALTRVRAKYCFIIENILIIYFIRFHIACRFETKRNN